MQTKAMQTKKDTKLERLAGLPLFRACTKAELRAVAATVDEIRVPAGRVLARRGAFAREFLIITDGRASAWTDEGTVRELVWGEHVGDTELITGEASGETVITDTACTVVVVDARRFSSLIEHVPTVARNLLKEHALRSRRANDRAYGRVAALPAYGLRPATA